MNLKNSLIDKIVNVSGKYTHVYVHETYACMGEMCAYLISWSPCAWTLMITVLYDFVYYSCFI